MLSNAVESDFVKTSCLKYGISKEALLRTSRLFTFRNRRPCDHACRHVLGWEWLGKTVLTLGKLGSKVRASNNAPSARKGYGRSTGQNRWPSFVCTPLTRHGRRSFERICGSKPERIRCCLPKLMGSPAQRNRYRRFWIESRTRVVILSESFHDVVYVQGGACRLENFDHMLYRSCRFRSPKTWNRYHSFARGLRVLSAQSLGNRDPLSKGFRPFQNGNQLSLG